MVDFRRTSIQGRKEMKKSSFNGDLIAAGALIFTKTSLDLYTIKQGDGYWRILIHIMQSFHWKKIEGNPSTITHVVGWDGQLAFGSDLCDPEGGGLNRHSIPIVPHCFTSGGSKDKEFILTEETIEVVNKRRNCEVIKIQDLSLGDYEVIQPPKFICKDYLSIQEMFANKDIKYSFKKAIKCILIKSKFSKQVKRNAIAHSLYAILGHPFRDSTGAILQVCCSTFQSMLLMAAEHKICLEKLMNSDFFPFKNQWARHLISLEKGFIALDKYHHRLLSLKKEFNQNWKEIEKTKKKEKNNKLLELCFDFNEEKSFIFKRIRKLNSNIAKRIYKMASQITDEKIYNQFFDTKEAPLLFKVNPESVTPAKLFFILYQKLENEP